LGNTGMDERSKDDTSVAPPPARLARFVFIGLASVVALAPLPLGAARPLAWDAMALTIAILLIVILAVPLRDISLPEYMLLPTILFIGIVIFIVMQTISETPISWHSPIWDQTSYALGKSINGAIAVDLQAAFISLLRLLSYAGIFFLSMLLCRERSRAHAAIKLVSFSGGIYATYGLVIFWSGNKTILWFSKWAYLQDLTGPFVNRNSFATYLGLCTLATICYLVLTFEQLDLSRYGHNKLARVIEYASARAPIIVYLFILITALFLTHSRGGLLSTLAGILALVIAIASAPSLERFRRLGWLVSLLAIILIALFISGDFTLQRLTEIDSNGEGRLTVYELTAQAIHDYPLFGTGFGSFAYIFPFYRSPAITLFFDFAHNDYLQNLLELGIPISVCLFAVVCWLVILCVRGIRVRRRDAIYPCLGIAASVLVALHATIDFSLEIPAVSATYMFLLGAAVAQSRTSQKYFSLKCPLK
jgi:O-antigen ligase